MINGVKLETYTAKEGEVLLDDADRELGIKQKNDILGIALSKRDITTNIINRTEANAVINSSGLSADDQNDLFNLVNSRMVLENSQRDIVKEENAARLLAQSATPGAKPLSVPDMAQMVIRQELSPAAFKSLEARTLKPPQVDDRRALDAVNTALLNLGDAKITRADADAELTKWATKLTNGTVNSFQLDIGKEFNASTDKALSQIQSSVRLQAVGPSENSIAALVRAIAEGLPEDEERVAKISLVSEREKFNLELDQYNRWNASMRQWGRDNLEAGPEEILIEGMRKWKTEFAVTSVRALQEASEAEVEELKRVRVKGPDGTTGTVAADDLQRAIDAGFEEI